MQQVMAEAMLPPHMRVDSNNNDGTPGTPKSCLNAIGIESTDRAKRKRNNVVIAIPAEIKRVRMLNPSNDTRKIIEDVSTALSRVDRLAAISSACATLNHSNISDHDNEIKAHFADAALCKHLSFLLSKELQKSTRAIIDDEDNKKMGHSRFEESDDEIGYTCSALEMVYRCSAPVLKESFEKIGYELLDLILTVLSRNFDKNDKMLSKCSSLSFSGWLSGGMKNDNSTYNMQSSFPNSTNGIDPSRAAANFSDMAARKATKILCHLARVGSIIENMAQYPGLLYMLKCIVDTVNKKYEEDGKELSNIEDETRINSLWILGNLSCTPDNMCLISNYEGMMDTLLNVMKQVRLVDSIQMDSPSNIQRIAAAGESVRVFLNLSWVDKNKSSLAQRSDLIETLIRLVKTSCFGLRKDFSSLILSMRRHAIGTLRNIAATPFSTDKLILCQNERGSLLALLAVIMSKRHCESDNQDVEDLDVKEKAIATLYNLVCEETVNLIGLQAGLLDALIAAGSTNDQDGKSGDVPKLVEKTLLSLQMSCKPAMESHVIITKAITPPKVDSSGLITSV